MSLRSVRTLLLVLLALEAALLLSGPQPSPPPKDEWWADAITGLRLAAWINSGLLLVLIATSNLWTRAHPSNLPPSAFRLPPSPRWFWPLTLLAILTCLGLRLPLASKSLWWDESWVVMQVTHGK